MLLTDQQVIDYKKNGWIKIKSGLSEDEIDFYSNLISKTVEKAKKINYPFVRIYHDFITSNNMAALEAPMHKDINDENYFHFFKKLDLGKNVCKLTKWQNTFCSLIRLFCMNNYNYSGHWHRDRINIDEIVQASIYLKSESGFKIRKKKLEIENKEKYTIDFCNNISKEVIPFLMDDDEFHTLSADRGDIIFFEPALIHKGSSSNSRLQFHMRFHDVNSNEIVDQKKIKDENNELDFYFSKFYAFDASHEEREKELPILKKRSDIFQRIKNTINYNFPYRNFKSYLKLTKKHSEFKFNLFANSKFQKD